MFRYIQQIRLVTNTMNEIKIFEIQITKNNHQ